MEETAHNCPDCGSELMVEDRHDGNITYQCDGCDSRFWGNVESGNQTVIGRI